MQGKFLSSVPGAKATFVGQEMWGEANIPMRFTGPTVSEVLPGTRAKVNKPMLDADSVR
jgi:hypothetical protein